MLKMFLPNEHVKDIYEITPEKLKARGIKGVITDLDNTLVEWDRPNATPKLIEWLSTLEKENIKVTIVSNNSRERVESFSTPLKIQYIFRARKPLQAAFHRALKVMNLNKDEVCVIGDQLLTDVFGGNRGGFHTILVVPVASTDGFWTRFNRSLERRILNWFKKKGMLTWEEQKN
jgi:HAD superfamily phosphatase (TIGR01668 family)